MLHLKLSSITADKIVPFRSSDVNNQTINVLVDIGITKTIVRWLLSKLRMQHSEKGWILRKTAEENTDIKGQRCMSLQLGKIVLRHRSLRRCDLLQKYNMKFNLGKRIMCIRNNRLVLSTAELWWLKISYYQLKRELLLQSNWRTVAGVTWSRFDIAEWMSSI